MRKALYDMLYLVICGIQQVKPQQSYVDTIDWEKLYKVSRVHFLNVLVGMTLKESGATLPKEWEQDLSKAVRKNVLFDVERMEILKEFERLGRELCKKIFEELPKFYDEESLKENLTTEEVEMLDYYLTSGVYGTKKRGIENRIKKFQKKTGKKK